MRTLILLLLAAPAFAGKQSMTPVTLESSPTQEAQLTGKLNAELVDGSETLDASQRSTNISLLLNTPVSTADCVKVYGVLFANIPVRDKDCVKIAMYHELKNAGLDASAYTVMCSTKAMKQVFGSSETCLLALHQDYQQSCATRQARLEEFALEECTK